MQERLGTLWDDLTRSGFRLAITWGIPACTLPAPTTPTPFIAVPTGQFLLLLYGWR